MKCLMKKVVLVFVKNGHYALVNPVLDHHLLAAKVALNASLSMVNARFHYFSKEVKWLDVQTDTINIVTILCLNNHHLCT